MTRTSYLGFFDICKAKIVGAYPEAIVSSLIKKGIEFWEPNKQDDITVTMFIYRRDFPTISDLSAKGTYTVEIIENKGLLPFLSAIKHKMRFVLCILLMTGLIFSLQGRIWFIRINGNHNISAYELLDQLNQCGIAPGTAKSNIDLYSVKNNVLARLPQIDFITVNIDGCIANVMIRERDEPERPVSEYHPSNIFAKKSGMIASVTAVSGTPAVKPGDVVSSGDLLISGVTALDKTMLITEAKGEIFARTYYDLKAVIPMENIQKQYTGQTRKVFSLHIGKNKINFFKTSGISYDNYDKMTESYYLTLPKGLALPLSFHITTFRAYKTIPMLISSDTACGFLTAAVREQAAGSMVAGQILAERSELSEGNHSITLTAQLECLEEIGYSVKIQN